MPNEHRIIIEDKKFDDERSLYFLKNAEIKNCVFEKGESPLKEYCDIEISDTLFRWKYPIWYCTNVSLKNCVLFEMARAGIWYTTDIKVEDAIIEAPKNFRRAKNIYLSNVNFPNAAETLWNCDNVKLNNVSAKGDYFAMNTNNIAAENFTIVGNYSFDGTKNAEFKNCRLISKDAFWNTENVTVRDSFITGEYLGWNSKNLTLENCTIESLQGMCYIEKLKMKNCRLINTTLAFEYSEVETEISGGIESVLNPKKGEIRAEKIGTLIIQKDFCKSEKTKIICNQIENTTDEIDWNI